MTTNIPLPVWLAIFYCVLGIITTGFYPGNTKTVKLSLYIRGEYLGEYTAEANSPVPELPQDKFLRFIIHGWFNTPADVDVLLQAFGKLKKDNNIIFMVDWSDWSYNPWYPSSCGATVEVGRKLAAFVRNLERNQQAKRHKMHLIGYSLGGKVSAATASFLKPRKLRRITGLDTPNYCFTLTEPKRTMLDPSDALYVDTIRTTPLSSPWERRHGHNDFFTCPNCTPGNVQKAHYEAVRLFALSIYSKQCQLTGRTCMETMTEDLEASSCNGTASVMGFRSKKTKRKRTYMIRSVPNKCRPSSAETGFGRSQGIQPVYPFPWIPQDQT